MSEELPSSKAEAVERIILNLDEYKSFKELKKMFEEQYKISVTKTYVRNIAMELYDNDKLEITKEIQGNNVAKKVKPKNTGK